MYSLVSDGDEFSFGRIHFTARHTPAHTSGHVVYILDGTPFHSQNSLFSGDLLFIAGAGDTVYSAFIILINLFIHSFIPFIHSFIHSFIFIIYIFFLLDSTTSSQNDTSHGCMQFYNLFVIK